VGTGDHPVGVDTNGSSHGKWAFASKSPFRQILLVKQIALHQLLEQFIPVQFADHAPGTVVIGDVCGILGEKVTDDLVNGVVTLFAQSVEYITKNSAHIFFVIAGNSKLNGVIARHVIDLLLHSGDIIAQIFGYVKAMTEKFL
jgi:hypothetical protein